MFNRVLIVFSRSSGRLLAELILKVFTGLEIVTASCPEEGLRSWYQSLIDGRPFGIIITGRLFDEGAPLDPWEMIREIREARLDTMIIAPQTICPEREGPEFKEVDPDVITFPMERSKDYQRLVDEIRSILNERQFTVSLNIIDQPDDDTRAKVNGSFAALARMIAEHVYLPYKYDIPLVIYGASSNEFTVILREHFAEELGLIDGSIKFHLGQIARDLKIDFGEFAVKIDAGPIGTPAPSGACAMDLRPYNWRDNCPLL